MRTTLTIDDELARRLKQRAQDTDRSFKDVVNEALKLGLEQSASSPAHRPYRIKSAALGQAVPGVDLEKALQLAGALEDAELARKMELRK